MRTEQRHHRSVQKNFLICFLLGLYWDVNRKFHFLVETLFIENIIQGDNNSVDLVSRLLFFVSNGITRDLPQTVSNHTSNYALCGPFRVLSSNFNFYIILHPPHLISVAIGNFLQKLSLYLLSFNLHRHMHTRICSWWHCLFIGWNCLLLITNLSLKINSFDVVGLFCVLPNSLLDLLIPNFPKINSIYYTRIIK